jgi:hypothetical protein
MLTQLAAVLFLLITLPATAQELEPRAYSPAPVGTTFLVASFGSSSGDISFDPTIAITNVHADLYAPVLGLGRTIGLLGRQGLITASLPYAWGTVSGNVGEQRGSITRSGLADIKLRFSLNLHGSPAMNPQEFARPRHRKLIVATSLTVNAPSGQYDRTKLISLGTNRWAFKPEIGFSYPIWKFDLDFYTGVWLFTKNPHFFPGPFTRTQDALTSFQAHASYTIRRGLWLAFDSTWYGGGSVRVNDGPASERQANSRVGVTLSAPLGKRQSLKFAFSSGVTARVGSKFNTLGVAWQYVWFRH